VPDNNDVQIFRWFCISRCHVHVPECSNGQTSEAAGEKQPEAYLFSPAHPKLPRQLLVPMGYVEDFSDPRTKLDACFNILPLHVPVFSEQLHPAPFILRAARSLCHRGVPQLVNDVVH
jgi:hypothetical protein